MANAYDLSKDKILKLIALDSVDPPWAKLMPRHKTGEAIYQQNMPDHVISATRTPIVVRSTLPNGKRESSCVYIINAKADQELTVHLTSTPASDGKCRVVMLESTTKEFLIDERDQSPVSANVRKDHIYYLFMVANTTTTNFEYVLTLGTPPAGPDTGSIEVTKEMEGRDTGSFTIAVNDAQQTFDASNKTRAWKNLQPGEYTISEKEPAPGWSKMPDIKVHVAAGETVKLTLPNTYTELEDPPSTGSIEVTKVALEKLQNGIENIATQTSSISGAQTAMQESLSHMESNLVAGDGNVALGLSFVQQSVESLQQSVNALSAASSIGAGASLSVPIPQPVVAPGIQQMIDIAYAKVIRGPKPKNSAEFRQMLEKRYAVDPETGQVVRRAQNALGYSAAGLASAVPAQQNLIDLVAGASKHTQALDQLEEADEICDDTKRLIKLIRANLQTLQQAASEEHPSKPLIQPRVNELKTDSDKLSADIARLPLNNSPRRAQLTAWAALVVAASRQINDAFEGYWTPGIAQDQQSEATQRLQVIAEDLGQLERAYDQAGLSLAERKLETVTSGSESSTVQSVLSSITGLLEQGPALLDAGDDGLDRLKSRAGTSAVWVDVLPDLANAMVIAARDELSDHLNNLASKLSPVRRDL